MPEPSVPTRPIRVLLVEDEEELARLLSNYLRSSGVEVMVAPDGETAWQNLLTQRPDVMVADLMIPGRSGPELIASARDNLALAAMPIIAISASLNAGDSTAEMCKLLDVNAALPKPFQLKELLGLIQKLAAAQLSAGSG